MTRLPILLSALAALMSPTLAVAGPICGQVPDTLIVFDRSGSMALSIAGKSKLNIARDAVNNLTLTFAGQLALGLEIFPGAGSSCTAGKINVAPGPTTGGAIRSALGSIFPTGKTPIASSLATARSFLQSTAKVGEPQFVLLITDGIESCGGNDVVAASQLAGTGVKTYVVGFGGGVNPTALTQMAQAGGTGHYYQADNPAQLTAALQTIAGQISCCGNGVLDQGEQCDKAILPGQTGACIGQCHDNDPCTTDQLIGKECSARCVFTKITAPKNNDGCCPAFANANTDNDCPKVCGNGILDVGERCDTGIPQGKAGACPATCDDGDACTADKKVDTGCMASCIHKQICKCGNGQFDNGELCDPKIPHGKPHACPIAADCADTDPCTVDRVDGQGCQQKCVNEPTKPKLEGSDSCCPAHTSSVTDPDCPPPCGPDRTAGCIDVCAGVTCPDGQYCDYGTCKAWPNGAGGSGTGGAGGSGTGGSGAASGEDPAQIVGGCSVNATRSSGLPAILLILITLGAIVRRRRRA